MRKSTAFAAFTAAGILLLGLAVYHAHAGMAAFQPELAGCARMVKELRLTDLCLFTEARYTRNPAMADMHAPFQDHPGALEHFPSGSFVAPPRPDREAR